MNVLVLMATYNGEQYIEEQLASIFSQKNVNVSVLIRDDGSSDKTLEILDKWKRTYNLAWYKNGHKGVAYGFLDLMQSAKVYKNIDYYAFSDQDDVWDEDKLEIACEELSRNANSIPQLYYCGQTLVDKDLNVLSVHNLDTKRSWFARYIFTDIAGCTAVFNQELLNKVNEYIPQYVVMHDTWIVKVCLALGGNVIVDSNAHMKYRQHGNNTIGLENSILNKIIRGKRYVFEYEVKKQIQELEKGYAQQIVCEYQKLHNLILNYKKNSKLKKELLDKENVRFSSKGLQFIYWIKIILNKL